MKLLEGNEKGGKRVLSLHVCHDWGSMFIGENISDGPRVIGSADKR